MVELPSELVTIISVSIICPFSSLLIVVCIELPLESVINSISIVVLSLFLVSVTTFVSPILGSSVVVSVSELVNSIPSFVVIDLLEIFIKSPLESFVVITETVVIVLFT